MHIAIHRHGRANLAIALHASNGNRNIVNHAEAFTVVRKRVMKSSANIHRHAVLQRILRGKNRAARR